MLHIHDITQRLAKCPATCLFAAIFTVLLPLLQFFHDQLLFQRHLIAAGEIWRIWTGSLVHTNYWHAALNILGFWILALIQQHPTSKLTQFAQMLFITTCVGAGLWLLSPGLIWYAGFSGVLYGLYLLAGIHLLVQREWPTAALILLGVCGKTVWDWLHGGVSLSSDLIDAPVVYAAHIYGMLGGLALGLPQLLKPFWNR
ncbi:rhombosortase [Candidatus Thiothrix sp. Deng01]|uniref:Rhombosortase n=1 Tax=Candidatus Thiothrix phosphatis TaxID=3112415 RepID=A0ABU6D1B9_9GAMM|nr:rhombosortase [Candidatus Thiothrix sp. Deng01]MEB4592162.1 rhombosortase [Candidatus Thiothrix sp. Deng01]